MTTAASKRVPRIGLILDTSWPLVFGFAILAIPTAISLADQTWSREDGAQGPIIIATGAWLLWRRLASLRASAVAGAPWLTASLLALSLPVYALGRALGVITLEAAGLYGAGLAMLHDRFGGRTLLRAWFPLIYLAFAAPPPSYILDHLTAPLKHLVAVVSTASLHAAGLPVAREGVTIFIAQYQLLVENACAGMNSILGLTAISLLYIYLARAASPAYALMLTLLVIPIAIIANIVRVISLILITYVWGDGVGQSFIHYAAGLFLFATALLLVFAVDRGLQAAVSRARAKR
jgi:exosortase